MKKNIFNAYLNLKKKKNILVFIIMLSLFILLFLLVNLSSNLNTYIYNLKYKNLYSRNFDVDISSSNLTEEDISTIEHVTSVIKFNDRLIGIELGKYKDSHLMAIDGEEYRNLHVVDGTKELGNYSIICPTIFIPVANYEDSEFIRQNSYQTSTLINKEFDVQIDRVESIIDEEKLTLEHKILDTKKEKFRIVGTYNNKEYMLESDTCFISKEDMQSIIDYSYVNLDESTNYSVIVDNIDNKETVKKYLEKNHCIVNETLSIDVISIFIISMISIIIFIIIIVAISVSIKLIIKRDLKMRENELLVYKCIGYCKKDIKNIYSLEYLIVLLLSFVFAIIIGSIIMNIIVNRYAPLITYNALDISIQPLSYIIVFIVGILYSELVINRNIKKILESR